MGASYVHLRDAKGSAGEREIRTKADHYQ